MAAITPAAIIAKFPEFAKVSSVIIQSAIDEANLFFDPPYLASKYGTFLQLYYAAHIIWTGMIDTKGDATSQNEVTGKSVGEISVQYAVDTSATTGIWSEIKATDYGKKCYRWFRKAQAQLGFYWVVY